MKTLILSDIHLGNRHCNIPLLSQVLDKEPFDKLILNGDTLQSVNLRKLTPPHWALLERFRKIGKTRELILIRGNHDHEIDFTPDYTGDSLTTGHVLPSLLEVPMREQHELVVRGETYPVLHGDRFDPSIRNPIVTDMAVACYNVTTKINKKLAKWLKKKSKRWSGLLEVVRQQSISFARQISKRGVIIGHTHFAEDTQFGDIHYLNSGSWTEHPCSYLIHDGNDIELKYISD